MYISTNPPQGRVTNVETLESIAQQYTRGLLTIDEVVANVEVWREQQQGLVDRLAEEHELQQIWSQEMLYSPNPENYQVWKLSRGGETPESRRLELIRLRRRNEANERRILQLVGIA